MRESIPYPTPIIGKVWSSLSLYAWAQRSIFWTAFVKGKSPWATRVFELPGIYRPFNCFSWFLIFSSPILKSTGTTLAPALSRNLTCEASINYLAGNGSTTFSGNYACSYLSLNTLSWVLTNSSCHFPCWGTGWVRIPIIGFWIFCLTWCPAPTMGEWCIVSCMHCGSSKCLSQSNFSCISGIPLSLVDLWTK